MLSLNVKKHIKNRTFYYLRPIFNANVPKWLKSYLKSPNNIRILGWFRDDWEYRDATEDEENIATLFLVFDTNGIKFGSRYKSKISGKADFYRFLSRFRTYKYAICDYPVKMDNRDLHVCVFKMQNWDKSFLEFDKGNFSKMYDEEEKELLKFYVGVVKNADDVEGKEMERNIYWCLSANPQAKEYFKKRVEECFGSSTKVPTFPNEYEIALNKDEILNYEKKKTKEQENKPEEEKASENNV